MQLDEEDEEEEEEEEEEEKEGAQFRWFNDLFVFNTGKFSIFLLCCPHNYNCNQLSMHWYVRHFLLKPAFLNSMYPISPSLWSSAPTTPCHSQSGFCFIISLIVEDKLEYSIFVLLHVQHP